jgi:hypothetical protein
MLAASETLGMLPNVPANSLLHMLWLFARGYLDSRERGEDQALALARALQAALGTPMAR